MINIFERLSTWVDKLNNPTKNYWENDVVTWDKAARAPGKDKDATFNEQEMFEAIRQSDIKRLMKFG